MLIVWLGNGPLGLIVALKSPVLEVSKTRIIGLEFGGVAVGVLVGVGVGLNVGVAVILKVLVGVAVGVLVGVGVAVGVIKGDRNTLIT